MSEKIAIISEVIILIFNILIFMKMTVLKKECLLMRALMYGGTVTMLGLFFFVVYSGILPEAISSFVCVTIPSFTLFFILSKYKDSRFFVTFCLIDTVTYIIAFFSRIAGILGSPVGQIISSVVAVVLMVLIYILGTPYFKKYRDLMANVENGWGIMAFSTFLIYVLLIFMTAYPEPMKNRPDYVPVCSLVNITVLSFYAVFLLSIYHRKKLSDLNIQLINEKKWHGIAYNDILTGMKNRMAFVEAINKLERTMDSDESVFAIMMDLNNFKMVNDTRGHYAGDEVLKCAAGIINGAFSEDNFKTYRIGGDEFAVISRGISEEVIMNKVETITGAVLDATVECTLSVGYAKVRYDEKNAVDNAFIRADKKMYGVKSELKAKTQN